MSTLTTEQLDELRRLEAAATPGPWASNRGYEQGDPGVFVCPVAGGYVIACEDQGPSEADADLIVAARNALPSLLTGLDTARAELAAAERRAGVATLRAQYWQAGREAVVLDAEVKRLSRESNVPSKVGNETLSAALSAWERVTSLKTRLALLGEEP